MAIKHREREALLNRIKDGLIRSANWTLEPSDENIAAATIVVASVLQDLVKLAGPDAMVPIKRQLDGLVKEGLLLP